MGAIQNSINAMLGSAEKVAIAGKGMKTISKGLEDIDEVGAAMKADKEQKAKEAYEAQKAEESYRQPAKQVLAEIVNNDPNFADSKNFSKALDTVEKKIETMKKQREYTRIYRDQFEKGSPEWNKIEAEGQARKAQNIADLRAEITKQHETYKKQQTNANNARKVKGGK